MKHKFASLPGYRQFGALFMAVLFTLLLLPGTAHAATVRIYVSPASGGAINGNSFTVQVRINKDANTSLEIVQADLTFPANLLNVSNVNSVGSNYNQSNSLTSSYNNSAGTVHIKGHNTAIPSTGDFLVANMVFTAKGVGTAKLNFANSTEAGRMNNSGNVSINKIDVMSGGQYVLTASPAPPSTPTKPSTPAPTTPTPTPTPAPTGSTPSESTTTPTDTSTSSDTPSNTTADDTSETPSTATPARSDKSTSKKPDMVLVALGGLGALLVAGYFVGMMLRRRKRPALATQTIGPDTTDSSVFVGSGLPVDPDETEWIDTPEPASDLSQQPAAEPALQNAPALDTPQPLVPAEATDTAEPFVPATPQAVALESPVAAEATEPQAVPSQTFEQPEQPQPAAPAPPSYEAAFPDPIAVQPAPNPEPTPEPYTPTAEPAYEEPLDMFEAGAQRLAAEAAAAPAPAQSPVFVQPDAYSEPAAVIAQPEPAPLAAPEPIIVSPQAEPVPVAAPEPQPAPFVPPSQPETGEPLDMFEVGEQRLAAEEANRQLRATPPQV